MKNTDYPQTWLSLSGMCDRLRLTPTQVRTLAKKGCLAVIGGKGNVDKRYLDPTPEYREQLRLGAMIHQRAYPVPAGITEKALLTNSECGEIIGMSTQMMNRYLTRNSIPSIKVTKALFLYPPTVVREAMLKRAKKSVSRQKSLFLISELVDYFKNRFTAELSLIPTDKEFADDERLQLRLSQIVTEAQKSDFAKKVKLAQAIVQILEHEKGPSK